MKQPELKLGRRVIAWSDEDPTEHKGVYIYDDGGSELNYVVWLDGDAVISHFDHVKPDLTAEPMNGDEVEVSDDGNSWLSAVYGHYNVINKKHYTMQGVPFNHVRFPQSKRDRVKEAIRSWQESSKVPMYDDLADQIDKIYTEES